MCLKQICHSFLLIWLSHPASWDLLHQLKIYICLPLLPYRASCITKLWCKTCPDANTGCILLYGGILVWTNNNHFFWRQFILIACLPFFCRIYSFLPGAAYVLGFSQREQHGPSHQATLVMALTSPRTCDVVFKMPEVTISSIFYPEAVNTLEMDD